MIDSFINHFQQGLYHILHFNAYEHLLFLIVLVLPYIFKDWKRVLVLTTAFIFGNFISITFIAYKIVSVSPKMLAILVPLSIFIVALYNIFTSGKKTNNSNIKILLIITLIFGLIHGFDYANAFQGVISSSETKLLTIVAIALGIETGQLVVVFIVMFLSFLCQTIFRFSKRDWVMVISAIILGCILPTLLNSSYFS